MDRTSRFMFQWSTLPMATLFLNLFLLRFVAVLQARRVCGWAQPPLAKHGWYCDLNFWAAVVMPPGRSVSRSFQTSKRYYESTCCYVTDRGPQALVLAVNMLCVQQNMGRACRCSIVHGFLGLCGTGCLYSYAARPGGVGCCARKARWSQVSLMRWEHQKMVGVFGSGATALQRAPSQCLRSSEPISCPIRRSNSPPSFATNA